MYWDSDFFRCSCRFATHHGPVEAGDGHGRARKSGKERALTSASASAFTTALTTATARKYHRAHHHCHLVYRAHQRIHQRGDERKIGAGEKERKKEEAGEALRQPMNYLKVAGLSRALTRKPQNPICL